MKRAITLILSSLLSLSASALELPSDYRNELQQEHGFRNDELDSWFESVQVQQTILEAISKPAEQKKTWTEYRNIFLTQERIDKGLVFWQNNRAVLERAEQTYGVPAEIIVAIIGVETRYGKTMGKYRVIDALSTLAFYYPRRSAYFKKELTQFLLLCREQAFDPLSINGSYAGAMGYGQFMPTSYRKLSVDFDGDGQTALMTSTADAIGSVAHYFNANKWQTLQPVAYPVNVKPGYESFVSTNLKPQQTLAKLQPVFSPLVKLDAATAANLLELNGDLSKEYWLTLNNFYVITRYNTSSMYAMAVYQLSQELKQGMQQLKPSKSRHP